MPRINKPLESFPSHILTPQILGAWLRGLRLGGKEHFTINELEDGLVALCEAVQPATRQQPDHDEDWRF